MQTVILVLATLATIILPSPIYGQGDSCPVVPDGLVDIHDLEWVEPGETIIMRLGHGPGNPYFSAWMEWDILSGEMRATSLPGEIEVIQLVDGLDIMSEFYSARRPVIDISPSLQSAIYVSDNPLAFTVYAIDADANSEPVELGRITQNLTSNGVLWISDNELILVAEPIYGPGYYITHVCLDGSCFVDVTELVEAFTTRPSINVERRELAFFDEFEATLLIYDLDSHRFQHSLPLPFRVLPEVAPVWSESGNTLYVLGFGAENIADLTLYELNPTIEAIRVVAQFDLDSYDYVYDWLISLQQRYIIISTPELEVLCY